MLSFTGSLNTDGEAFVIFVNEKYGYKDKKGILSKDTIQKINSFLAILKAKRNFLLTNIMGFGKVWTQ